MGSMAEVELLVARPCEVHALDLPFSHRIERPLERQGILVAGLDGLMSQVGGACGMPVQVVERRCSVCPIERLPVPPGLHAAADNVQQLLPLLVQLENLFVQLSPPPLQRVALRYRRLPTVVRAHLGGLSNDEIRFPFTHEIGVHPLQFIYPLA
jgi:hypothetical protein